ncbi:MAG: response regulator [Chitinophagales bacterium]
MAEKLKIGIVEDDLIIAESIYSTLKQIGYEALRPVRNFDDAIALIKKEAPDLLILDITIEGRKDGIDLAAEINNSFKTPFIFLTAYSDENTLNRSKKVNPAAYLVKPFSEKDLYSSIEIAINNYRSQGNFPRQNNSPKQRKFALIKDGHLFHKINFNDILYIESDNVYLSIYTPQKKFVIREKLGNFIQENPNSDFVKVHRSYAINTQHLETVNELYVVVAGKEIPVQKNYRKELLEMVRLFK